MIYSHEVEMMCPVAQGVHHGAAPIPEEAKWVQAKEVKDISGFTHGVGWCAPQQGACKLSLNVKEGIIQEALVETIGCSGMTHSARKGRRNPGGSGGDTWLLRYDALRSYGSRGSSRKNDPRGAEHRPCM